MTKKIPLCEAGLDFRTEDITYLMAVMAVPPCLLSVFTMPNPGANHSVPSMLNGIPMPIVFIVILLLYVILKQSQVPAEVVTLSFSYHCAVAGNHIYVLFHARVVYGHI